MARAINLDSSEYQLVLVEPVSRTVAALEDGGQFRLPHVSIPLRMRLARQLRLAIDQTFGVPAAVIDFLPLGGDDPRCVVAELLNTDLPGQLRLIDPQYLVPSELSECEQSDLEAILLGVVDHLVSRIGWMDEVVRWFEGATGLKACAKESIEQHNAGRGFALLRIRAQGEHSFWLKATCSQNRHERSLTKLLCRACPHSGPNWVAEKPEWNAWLMRDEACTREAHSTEQENVAQLLRHAVGALAELQSKTVAMESALFAAGAFDQRLQVVRADADPLFSYLAEAMDHQTSLHVAPIPKDRLDEIRRLFEETCSRTEILGCPPTIVHGDMSLGNLVAVQDGCQFIDWSEGYVGHPFVTLQHLLQLNPMECPEDRESLDEELKHIYRRGVRERFTSGQIEEGFASMPLLAAACAVYGRGDWLHSDARRDPRRYVFARGVARYMDRAAREQLPCNAEAI